jgi:CheY-like chemotaxis protein
MAKPVIVVVDDEEASRRSLTEELESRYGGHYQIVSAARVTTWFPASAVR